MVYRVKQLNAYYVKTVQECENSSQAVYVEKHKLLTHIVQLPVRSNSSPAHPIQIATEQGYGLHSEFYPIACKDRSTQTLMQSQAAQQGASL